eukprot:CAMPEP_0170618600 /NCGR_PEP_ID=MMETSP0224-20130122/27044_1 /TAXON_ID=285029 /ORGANISM="Togula jolla, Strain CCCM 725" /LENGTH=53 /DNA_ID=CAMNT_0010944583 /DNA_START=116 /DNA_END=273 /DNA_ORIENTATION=-
MARFCIPLELHQVFKSFGAFQVPAVRPAQAAKMPISVPLSICRLIVTVSSISG